MFSEEKAHIVKEDTLHHLFPISHEEVLGSIETQCDCRVQSSWGMISLCQVISVQNNSVHQKHQLQSINLPNISNK